jgi:hypothetical protein
VDDKGKAKSLTISDTVNILVQIDANIETHIEQPS